MSNFIALRPVQFDRGYEIGEEIPAGVVAPGSVKRLIDSGRIAPAQGAALVDTEAAAALEDMVAFLEEQLAVEYENGERDTLTIYDRAEVCKEGLASFMEMLTQLDGVPAGIPAEPPKTPRVGENDSEGTNTPPEGETPENDPKNAPQGSDNATGDTGGAFACPEPGCGRSFTTQAGLNSHMRVHQ